MLLFCNFFTWTSKRCELWTGCHHHLWAAVVYSGRAKASACRLQVSLSCAVLCHARSIGRLWYRWYALHRTTSFFSYNNMADYVYQSSANVARNIKTPQILPQIKKCHKDKEHRFNSRDFQIAAYFSIGLLWISMRHKLFFNFFLLFPNCLKPLPFRPLLLSFLILANDRPDCFDCWLI